MTTPFIPRYSLHPFSRFYWFRCLIGGVWEKRMCMLPDFFGRCAWQQVAFTSNQPSKRYVTERTVQTEVHPAKAHGETMAALVLLMPFVALLWTVTALVRLLR